MTTTPDESATPSTLLTVPEVARELRVDPATVRRYIASGDLPAVRVGRQLRVERVDLDRYLSRRRTSRPLTLGL